MSMTLLEGPDARESRNIYLTGFSGTGKSHSGRLAASRLAWEFVDTDQLAERRAGKPVPQIFAEDGEEKFRDIESAVLADVAAQGRRVVSTGGGVPVRPSNRDLMRRTGLVIRLKASPETVHSRVARGEGSRGRALRPLLGGDAPVERIRQLLAEREPAYAEADLTIDTDGKEPRDVAGEIVEAWRSLAKQGQTLAAGQSNSDNQDPGLNDESV